MGGGGGGREREEGFVVKVLETQREIYPPPLSHPIGAYHHHKRFKYTTNQISDITKKKNKGDINQNRLSDIYKSHLFYIPLIRVCLITKSFQ